MRLLFMAATLLVMILGSAVVADEPISTDFKSSEVNAEIKKLPELAATLRALTEARMKVARGELIEKLKAYQIKATQDGDLDEALKVRDTIAELEKLQAAQENLAGSGAAPKTVKASIPKKAVRFGQSMYYLITEPMTWAEAKKLAEEKGGHLARIESAEEHAFCAKLIQPISNNGDFRWAWIDGLAGEIKGEYFFSNGQPVKYLAWDKKKPSGLPGHQYLNLYAPTGLYYDGAGKPQPFICEWEVSDKTK